MEAILNRPIDVLALGNAIMDVLAFVDDDFLRTHAIAKGVMTLIDEARAASLYSVFPADRKEVAGGSAANTMAGLASFGGKGRFVGKVKNDALGATFAAGMKEIGVAFATAFAEAGPSTACCLVAVAPDGQRSMSTHLGISGSLGVADIERAAIADSQVLYAEGYLWDSQAANAATRKALALAHETGTKTAFTLSDPFCVHRYRDDFLALLQHDIDIVFANEEEAKTLVGTDDFDAVVRWFSQWKGIAAVTRSEKGCVVVGEGRIHAVPAVPVEAVVDTTGAGDQFAAGFLYGLTRGLPLETCGRLGSLAASEIITHLGARPHASLASLAG
jgi:sugar/nucleoside kinase (ribokinase family)